CVRVLVTPPVPRHSGHLTSTIVPTPWQSRQGSEKLNEPWLELTRPTPWQVGQVRGCEPGAAPLPWQVSQVPGVCRVRDRVTPFTASTKSRLISVSTSRPRPARRVAPPPPPEKMELNRSEKPAPPKRRSPPVPAPVRGVPGAPAPAPNRSVKSNEPVPAPPVRALRRNWPEPNSDRI